MKRIENEMVLFSDKETLSISLLTFVLSFILSIASFVFSLCDGDKVGIIATLILMFPTCVMIILILVLEARKWAALIRVTEYGIEYKQFLHKKTKKNFEEFRYITKAYRQRSPYSHSKQLSKKFIVISNRGLNETEIHCLTNVPNSSDLVKIEYSKKTYQKLLDILPESHKTQLIEQFEDLVET